MMNIEQNLKNNEKELSKKEMVKEYNAKYYSKNKEKLIANLCEKVQCNICGKLITKNRLKLHKTTALCGRTLQQKLRDEKIINDIIYSI